MTIITKPLTEKKGDKLVLPLVENDFLPPSAPEDPESQNPNLVILRARARRVSTTTTFLLLLASLVVVSIGIFVGTLIYDRYIGVQLRSVQPFRGQANIPFQNNDYPESQMFVNSNMDEAQRTAILKALADPTDTGDDSSNENNDYQDSDENNFNNIIRNYFFRESFEIDTDKNYEKINVPDFRDGRSGRFVHDFNNNVTGIIDITGKRCFVMPLNRGNVLPPKSLFDLIHKMWDGYYNVNTKVIRESMRVITPPLSNTTTVGTYIAKECEGLPIYKLEKFVSGVEKRSIHTGVKFAQFSGNGITEFDIINLDSLEHFEKDQK